MTNNQPKGKTMNEQSENTRATIAAALARPAPLSTAECNSLLGESSTALQNVGERLLRVHPGSGLHPVGAERKRALVSGTPEELAALQAEYEQLQALVDQLRAQNTELLARRSAARIREAFEGLPGMHQTLADKLTAAEAARDALNQALDDLDGTYTAIVQARGECHRGGVQGASSPRANIERLLELGSSNTIKRLASYNGRLGDVFGAQVHIERIGMEVDPDVEEAA